MDKVQSHINLARRLTKLMDTEVNIFGIRFGLDPLLNFIPFFGDLLGLFVSFYLFLIAWELKVPKKVYVQMLGNSVIDYLLGLIPVAGIVFDAFYRANIRNLALLEKYLKPEVLEGEVLEGEVL